MRDSLNFQILVFTLVRIALNTMHRMVYPFLAVFGRGLGVDLPTLALAVTARALGGTVAPFLAAVADNRGRKQGMLLGVALFTLGTGLVVFWPTYPVFVITLVLTLLGRYVFDPAMHAYLGDRVPYQRRGRAIAITEYGWSLSFIIGIPLMGFVIARRGWISPFLLLCLLGLASVLTLSWMLPRDPARAGRNPKLWANLRAALTSVPALLGLSIGLFISASNEVINLVFGVWLEVSFGLQIAALGAAAMVIGLAELGGETLTAGFVDRLGKANAVGLGLLANCLAALVLPLAGSSLPGALAGLFLFYLSFEFTVVSSIPLMTEVFPAARATLMAADVAAHSLGRALGALLAPALYLHGQSFTQLPTMLVSGLAAILLNLVALAALFFLRKHIQ